MMHLWPDVEEERRIEFRGRARRWELKLPPETPSWRWNGVLLAAVLFVLTLIPVVATFALLDHWKMRPEGLWTAVVAVAAAEVLILGFRFFRTGVESALWLGGLFAFIFGLKGPAKPEALLLFAAASAIAGLRVRQPLFGALAAVFVVSYWERKGWPGFAGIAILISLAAVLALLREWRRPSNEYLFVGLAVITPLAGADTTPVWSLAFAAAAVICAAIGLRARMHAPLIAAAVHLAVAAGILAAHEILPWRAEWSAIVAGAILLAASLLISRELRGRTRGIVATPFEITGFDEALQIGATLALQPKAEIADDEGRGGGRFGGAGATGEF
jgi:hypothetical protein